MNKLRCGMFVVLGTFAIAPSAIAVEQGDPTTEPTVTVTSQQKLASILKGPQKTDPLSPTPLLSEIITTPVPSDVPPTHWAYTAVDNLIEVYGCLEGYPDGTFRGDNPLTRYEFAAAVNACLDSFIQQVEAERQVDLSEVLAEMLELREELDELSNEVE